MAQFFNRFASLCLVIPGGLTMASAASPYQFGELHSVSKPDPVYDWNHITLSVQKIGLTEEKDRNAWDVHGKTLASHLDLDGVFISPSASTDNRKISILFEIKNFPNVTDPNVLRSLVFRLDGKPSNASLTSGNATALCLCHFHVPTRAKTAALDYSLPTEPFLTLASGMIEKNPMHIRAKSGSEMVHSETDSSGHTTTVTNNRTDLEFDIPTSSIGKVCRLKVFTKDGTQWLYSFPLEVSKSFPKRFSMPVDIPMANIGKVEFQGQSKKWHSLGKIPLYPK